MDLAKIFHSPNFDESSYFTSGRHLWRSVIHRAIQEAQGEFLFAHREFGDVGLNAGRLRREAVLWLTTDTLGLRRAFHFADLPCEFGEFVEMMRGRFWGMGNEKEE